MIIEIISFGLASAFFLLLGLLLLTGQRDILSKKMLVLASLVSAVWAGAVTYQAAFGGLINITLLLELLRALAWFGFLLVMLRTAYMQTDNVSRKFKITMVGVSAFIFGLMLLVTYRLSGGSLFEIIAGNDVLAGHLMISVGGLVITEQLYRNTPVDHRWALKYFWLALGSMFAYDFYLYSDALLFQRIDNELWNARGFIHAMVVPLIGLAIRREMQWSLGKSSIDIFISRRIVFHTTTLLAVGIYMILIGFGGYYVREFGGDWGEIAQATFIFGASVTLFVLLFSGKLRSRLRVLIDKHFFHYKYDYRDEWLRIIRTLSVNSNSETLHERAIRSFAQIIDSPGGILWLKQGAGRYAPDSWWNMEPVKSKEYDDSSFIRFLEEQQFVINLDEFSKSPEMYTRLANLEIPDWLKSIKNAWLVIPLMLNEKLLGFIILAHSPSHHRYFNWEDTDLLKTVGRQVASYIAQNSAAQELVNAKRFEEVNRLSAFIIHDLKNMIGQLSLVVSNAAKHKSNPLFIEDAVLTVENSVQKMNKLLSRIKGEQTEDSIVSFNLCKLLEEVVRLRSQGGALPIPLLYCKVDSIRISADRDRMAANLGHILQNAQDATDENGKINVFISRRDKYAIIEIEDTGCGMDERFIHEKLFQPFESTKGTMGIGVFQVREYIQKLGGELEVQSTIGKGTIFRMLIPEMTDTNLSNSVKSSVTNNL
ncbi:MAG: PEP-CTERM system histidine kinase PrsK [Gammaproteobacteria bacterium]|nr:PEP-CTERM system histidine kinase PrsK [Gammaproteobacteria bacterium]